MDMFSKLFEPRSRPLPVMPPAVDPDADDLLVRAEAALREVVDPEIGINIVDLGLVYALRSDAGMLEAEIGLTSQSCPLGDLIADQARDRLATVAGGRGRVRVDHVRNRMWSADLMSPTARRLLSW